MNLKKGIEQEWTLLLQAGLRTSVSEIAEVLKLSQLFFIPFLYSLLLAQTSYGISKIGSSFLNSLLSAQCSVGLVDWLKSLISWANTSWPFSCRRAINWETAFPTGSQHAMVLAGKPRSILVFPAITYLTASNMPMKEPLQRLPFLGKPREGRQVDSWRTFLASWFHRVMAFPVGLGAPKNMPGPPRRDTVRKVSYTSFT